METYPQRKEIPLKYSGADQTALRGLMIATLDLLEAQKLPSVLDLEFNAKKPTGSRQIPLPEGVVPLYEARRKPNADPARYDITAYLPGLRMGHRIMNRILYDVTLAPRGHQGGLIAVSALSRDFWPDRGGMPRQKPYNDTQLTPSSAFKELTDGLNALRIGKKMPSEWRWKVQK